ncbi:hypothetical protein IFM89_035389 [Coptis chinensis]|uniref:Bulb-type lectin domain-containing protein n=1 Tax=Coptis chinensis TaxID=261450 RepID=A0A835LLA3_9MAGN|nr:hypothetical protein IFM89_035389 [Coptis chinensis]
MKGLITILGGVVFWSNHQTTTFPGSRINSLDNVNELLLIFESPIDLVVVSSAKINHNVLVTEREHEQWKGHTAHTWCSSQEPRPGNSTNRYVGIWYNIISIRTVVWVANRENPIRNSSGIVIIGTDGNLVVSDGTGNLVWSTNISVASNNSSAVLVDSGNLLFTDDVRNPDKALRKKFEAPSDTYLPGMRVGLNPRNNETHRFTSWKSENDPSTGNFSLGVDPEGVAQIVIFENSRRRWRRVSDVGGRMYITYSVHSSSEILRFRIRWDGTEQQLWWDEGRNEWIEFWA